MRRSRASVARTRRGSVTCACDHLIGRRGGAERWLEIWDDASNVHIEYALTQDMIWSIAHSDAGVQRLSLRRVKMNRRNIYGTKSMTSDMFIHVIERFGHEGSCLSHRIRPIRGEGLRPVGSATHRRMRFCEDNSEN